MAIDPKTVLTIIDVAGKALKDDETRFKMLMTSLIPTIPTLLIMVVLMYILTSPLSHILEFFMDDETKAIVEEFKSANDSLVALGTGELIFNGDYPMPVVGVISSGYGYRYHPITYEYKFHAGIDIVPTWHSPIQSIAFGTVKKAGISKSYGQYVIIYHDMETVPFYSVYAHLSRIYVTEDQEVQQGTIIGLEGGEPKVDTNTGYSTGHHLHFEIRSELSAASHVDPVPYLFEWTNESEEGGSNETTQTSN